MTKMFGMKQTGLMHVCVPESNGPFLIEVTSLNRDAVEQRSGWPDQLDERAHAFSMITPNLWSCYVRTPVFRCRRKPVRQTFHRLVARNPTTA